MEWSRPAQQGDAPTPRAGHAGVTIGENWFIVGGGDNKSGRFMHFSLKILVSSLPFLFIYPFCEKIISASLFLVRGD